ncbi:hypothetical protein GWN49_09800 [Candidatus Bathyarchaeota archaeon]|nr:hypothetical protein [Candidatus Bathyarchaeota archaeon]
MESPPVERCPECDGSLLVHDQSSEEIVCTTCGFVITTKIMDRGPEWRAFTPEQYTKRAKVGARYTFAIHGKGLSTNIERRDIRGYPSERKAQLFDFVDGRGESTSPGMQKETSLQLYPKFTELQTPLICQRAFSKQRYYVAQSR